MANKLIVVIMGPGKKHFAEMCLESVKEADKILYWANSKHLLEEIFDKEIFYDKLFEPFDNEWDKNDKTTNGKCRQRYLNYLKQNYPNDWALCLDEDELLEEGGIEKIKKFISEREPGLYNVKMRHFIGDLGHEDATRPVHVVPCRLFKISEAIKYPEHSHPVLVGELMGACLDTCIWHLGHLPVEYMDYILKRYHQHSEDSVIHTQEFLKQWKLAHLLGKYPVREINPIELPKQICERYDIDKDEFYFMNRGLEVKHFIMTKQWADYFDNDDKICEFVEFGCGLGPYGYALGMYKYDYLGFDISKFAIEHTYKNPFTEYSVGDVTKITNQNTWRYKVGLCIDILEHLKYEDLDIALKNISTFADKCLFSIPYLGDPNLEADSTHIIKESKEWWVEKLSQFFNIKDAPTEWLFSNQLLIGEKK